MSALCEIHHHQVTKRVSREEASERRLFTHLHFHLHLRDVESDFPFQFLSKLRSREHRPNLTAVFRRASFLRWRMGSIFAQLAQFLLAPRAAVTRSQSQKSSQNRFPKPLTVVPVH